MYLYDLFVAIEASAIGVWARETLNVLAYVNVIHVLGVALVFGTILLVDLRLVGVAGNNRTFTQVSHDLLRWTWLGFGLAVLSGLIMFSANATTFYSNTQFWFKMAAIACAGLNMFIFELVTARHAASWQAGKCPPAARVAGLLSILFWVSVIVLGRWIGYTKGFNVGAIDIDLNSLDFLN